MERLDGGLLHRPVHPLGLSVGPGMVGLGELVLDAVLIADAVEGMDHPVPLAGSATGEGDAVVGQHSMDAVGEGGHHPAHEGGARGHLSRRVQLDVGELGDAIDGEEHVDLAFGGAQLAAVDVDVADPGLGEALALGGSLLVSGQAGDAVPFQAAVQGAAGEPGDALPQAAEDVIERQEGAPAELDHDRLLGLGQDGAAWPMRPHGRIRGVAPRTPLGDCLGVQPVAGGKGTGARLRRLELGSNARRRAGAAVQQACHSASSS